MEPRSTATVHLRTLFSPFPAPGQAQEPGAAATTPEVTKTSFTAATKTSFTAATKTSFTTARSGPGGWHICLPE